MKKFSLLIAFVLLAALLAAGPARAGELVSAQCPCGYKSGTMAIFGGMSNFGRVCLFPAYCPGVKKVLRVNMFQKPSSHPECASGRLIPYDRPDMCLEPGKHRVSFWNTEKKLGRNLILTDGKYLCPVCGKYTLKFRHEGLWD